MEAANETKAPNMGLASAIATGVGLIVATSCLLSLGQGSAAIGTTFIISMAIACALNIITALSMAELNALMPNLTGGLAQYTLACMGPFVSVIAMVGGYLVCNTMIASTECAMFGNTLKSVITQVNIPSSAYCIALLVVLIISNLNGVDVFAKIQDIMAYGLIISLTVMGFLGMTKLGSGTPVKQPAVLSSNFTDIASFCGLAFFLFIGCEFVIPISNKVKNARRNIPLGMILSLLIVMGMQVMLVLGFHNYVDWKQLGRSTTPHILYGSLLLGKAGVIWMAIVSIFAVTSTVNTIISSLSYIAKGMAKIKMLPKVFAKSNKKGAPYVSVLTIGGAMIVINATGLSTSSQLSFLILTGCVFWMIAYVISHCNVLILRHRLPKAPRTFKVPGGPVLPLIGMIGTVWMIYNISSNPAERTNIYLLCLIIFAALAVYAVIWIKKVMKRKLFKALPLKEVMAMENELYLTYHDNKSETGRQRKI
ncbi:MAG TPA: amino acid permease [Ruminococcaceae bacterium]|jgi:amino acid transporter|nr:APC family permease [Oscillospiraceae bacterium]HCA29029.1 amino acid permease [Oscillospiraceae bacterium]HCC01761.1 amino acid permease [Oscillospiraceae bacterium]